MYCKKTKNLYNKSMTNEKFSNSPEKLDFNLEPLALENLKEQYNLTVKNKELLKQWLPWAEKVNSIEDTEKFITESLEKQAKGEMSIFGIKKDSKLIGLIDIHAITSEKKGKIGYWLDEDEQGKGIITLATKKILDHGFNALKLNRIVLICAARNEKSCAVPKRLNFTKEGILRQAMLLNNRFEDVELWSMLKEEWINRKI